MLLAHENQEESSYFLGHFLNNPAELIFIQSSVKSSAAFSSCRGCVLSYANSILFYFNFISKIYITDLHFLINIDSRKNPPRSF